MDVEVSEIYASGIEKSRLLSENQLERKEFEDLHLLGRCGWPPKSNVIYQGNNGDSNRCQRKQW